MRQQAHEKAFEISVNAQRTFEREMAKETDNQNRKLVEEFTKKINQKEIDQKIMISKRTNECNLDAMKQRDNKLIELRELATNKLIGQYGAENPVY